MKQSTRIISKEMQRNHTLDTLRTIAALLVILLHVSAEYVGSAMDKNSYNLSFWIGNVFDSYSRIAVPIFVIISGELLVGRKESFIETYRKRMNRILIPLISWTIVYLIYQGAMNYIPNRNVYAISLIKSVILGSPFFHLWYLYMIAGLYLVIPIINNSILKTSRRNVFYISTLLLIFGSINTSYNTFFGNKPIFILNFINYLGYFLSGFLLKEYQNNISKKLLLSLYLISSLLISILTYYTAKCCNSLYFYGYLSPFVIIASFSFYRLVRQANFKENFLSKISHLTLGLYLIHAGILYSFLILLKNLNIHILDNAFIGIPIKFIVTFSISIVIANIFFKTKYLKRLI